MEFRGRATGNVHQRQEKNGSLCERFLVKMFGSKCDLDHCCPKFVFAVANFSGKGPGPCLNKF